MIDNLADNKYPEVVADLAAKFTELFQERGIDKAQELGWDAAILVNTELAGQQAYFPRRHLVSQRDRQIYREFNGTNHAYLAKKHDMTERQIYNIVARIRQEEFERNQLGLFG